MLAPPGKPVPSGERILIEKEQTATITKVAAQDIPPLQNPLLVIGMGAEDDTPPSIKQDIENLQKRLKALGFYQGEIDGNFGNGTDKAVKAFQTKEFGTNQADGKVGPITWKKLWGEDAPERTVLSDSSPPISGKNYLKLTKTPARDKFGCVILNLEYFKDGKLKDSLKVCSGGPTHQVFKTGPNSVPKSFEPLPEGKWQIKDIKWAGGKDKYDGKTFPVEGNGVGPVSTPLIYQGPNSTRRSAIEIHIDWNRGKGFAGTAGCIGISNIEEYKRFVTWLRETDPRELFVDWGLGTCPKP